jgi:Fur family peroxide stress response transcriptional regulator
MQKTVDISQYLNDHHIRPSYQRVRIFQYMAELRSHPTVDEIYNVLIGEIPTLSKTTVYNTLNLFVREKIAQPLSIEENQMRYDADTSAHGHFMCERCGEIFDFTVDDLKVSGLDHFQVNSRNVFYKGICPACRNR